MQIAFRAGVNADLRYIKATWLNSFRSGDGVRGVPNSYYFPYEEKVLIRILPRSSNAGGVLVAYEYGPDDTYHDTLEKEILGWICAEALETGLLVHYVYVRGFSKPGKHNGKQFRRQGIGAALLKEVQARLMCEGQPIFYTYRTSECWQTPEAREKLKELNASYVPYFKYSLISGGCEACGTPTWDQGNVSVPEP